MQPQQSSKSNSCHVAYDAGIASEGPNAVRITTRSCLNIPVYDVVAKRNENWAHQMSATWRNQASPVFADPGCKLVKCFTGVADR
jgi:hypothetical protein